MDKTVNMCIKDMYHKMNMANNKHISIGRIGEDIASKYLENRGFRTVERNYRKKWGEIDVICQKDSVLHFVEVKAVSWRGAVPKEGTDRHRPEDNVHKAKRRRLARAIESYLAEHYVLGEVDCTVDVLTVHIDMEQQKAQVEVLWNVLLD